MGLFTTDRIHRLEEFDGEDTCDLMRVIQESFGIEFTTDDLMAAETVGLLSDRISNKLTSPQSERCLAAVVFYRLRRAFVDLFGYSRAAIRPDTELIELLPWIDRKSRWRRLQGHLGLALPRLAWPTWLFCALLATSAAATWAYWRWAERSMVALAATVVVWLLACFLLGWILSPVGREFPRSCRTIGELSKVVLARNYAKLAAEVGASSPREVLAALRQLIAVETGRKAGEMSAETRFPEGLNIYY
jgi:hypothetical protein